MLREATENEKGLALALSAVVSAGLLCGLVWESAIIQIQREHIAALLKLLGW